MANAQGKDDTVVAAPKKPTAKVFRSFKQLTARFGPDAVASLKQFDFKANVLIWYVTEFDEDAKAEVVDVAIPLDEEGMSVQVTISAALQIDAVRTAHKVELFRRTDNPCSGGFIKPQEARQECNETVMASVAAARKKIVLFSTPRKGFKRAVVTPVMMKLRPAAAPHLR